MNYSKGLFSNKKWLKQKYLTEGLSLRAIARICNVTHGAIYDWVKHYNFKSHPVGDGRAERSPHWRGGLYKENGYRRINQGRGHGYKLEHRIIVEKIIGRPLARKEVIHHINFNRSDNHPNNLYLFPSNSEHMLYHHLFTLGKESILVSNLSMI